MSNRISLCSTLTRVAAGIGCMLCTLALSAAASAQTLPGTEALPNGGAGVTLGPDGAKVDLDAGDAGGVTVGAGPGGVNLGLRTTPKAAAPGGGGSDSPVSVPGGPTENPRSGSAPEEFGPPGRSVVTDPVATGAREGRLADRARRGSGERGARAGERGGLDGLRTTRTEQDDKSGIAPPFDLVERIPAAVRAGLVALALIAIALWALWVRGRRRLEHNAYLDPDTGIANMAAFEQILDREWQRAARYRRPLGLLLLDVEENGAGRRLLGEREARGAVAAISEEVREGDTVARLAPGRFAVVCPEAPAGSIETLAHALESKMEERRLRCWAGFAERSEADARPTDLVTRAAAALSEVHTRSAPGDEPEPMAEVVPLTGERVAA